MAAALALSLAPGLFASSGSAEAREEVTITQDVSDFDSIRLSGRFSGTVVVGDKESLAMTGKEGLEDRVIAEVRGNELRIRLKGNHRHPEKIIVAIEAKHLEKFIIEGAGKFQISNVDAEDFDIKLPGAASITVDGKCGELGIAIAGAATVNAENLICQHGRVRISGTGTISLHASVSIDARVSGLGKIEVYGNPEEIDQRVSGLGRIKLK
jgi:hypothetical protein